MSRARSKAASLTLEPAQEQAAVQVLKRFLEDSFDLELGSFDAQEVLDLVMAHPEVRYAEVEVDKPHALRFAESVSITLAGHRE